MKVKRLREDFVVREVTQFPLSGGQFAAYSLEKCGLGTPEAIQEVLKVWNLPRNQVSYGGLKDRHAVTSQIITIFRGPQKDIQQRSFSLNYLGQASRAFDAKDIQANAFEITLRDLTEQRVASIRRAIDSMSKGIPNYFDDQRFGSLGESGQFVAQPWCMGDYERALFLAIAEANSHDRPREREQKEILRTQWGNWVECKRLLDRSHRRSIVTYLCDHPTDFKRAIALIRNDLRSIYVAAFQSQLWNQMLVAWWRRRLLAEHLVTVAGAGGELLFPITTDQKILAEAASLQIPLPSARQHDWDDELAAILNEVLVPYQMQRQEIRLKFPRDTFFSKGIRSAMIVPCDFSCQQSPDELAESKDRQKLTLCFTLGRGQYATMVIKFLDQ
jgi:tRNA pseudouridine13 synthase